MTNLIKSSFYKLIRDWTFRITLIVGVALAVFMCLLYLGIDLLSGPDKLGSMCNGYQFYTSSLSPTQNFGLTVPINLIVFTIGEFNCGTIRNKIIAGNKKSLIYLSLIITGIIFTLTLMAVYFALSVGLSTLIGGFSGKNMVVDTNLLYQYPIMGLCTYIFIVTLAILVSSSIRNIGGSMPIVIIGIMLLYFLAFVPSITRLVSDTKEITTGMLIQQWVNPLYGFGSLGIAGVVNFKMETTTFVASIVTPLYWSIILIVGGIIIFNKKDVK